MLFSVIVAFTYIRYATFTYKTSSVIEIVDEAQSNEMALPTELTVFNRSMVNLQNEINVLKSFNLNKSNVKSLNSNVHYFRSGLIKRKSRLTPQDWYDNYQLEFKIDTDSVSKINEQLSSLRKFSDEKNEFFKKYQKFYDLGVLKSFVFDIIASIDNLENNIKKLETENKSQDSINAIKSAKDRLVILLENENIDVVEPNTNLKFNDPKQTVRCKVIETIKTSDESLVGMISSIIHSGYNGVIGPNNEITLLREAWVNIYSKNNEGVEENG